MSVDWPKLEDTLCTPCRKALREFTSEKPDQVFYAFAICAFLESGRYDIWLCLNTEHGLREAAIKNLELHPNATQREVQDILRFDPVEWKYTGINQATEERREYWIKEWKPYQSQLEELYFTAPNEQAEHETNRRFLESLCKVMLRLESGDYFVRLKRSDDFRTIVSANEEPEQVSHCRLAEYRQQHG